MVIIIINSMVTIIALNKSPSINDFHLSDVVAKHPWHEELARDPQRPREHCSGNAGPSHHKEGCFDRNHLPVCSESSASLLPVVVFSVFAILQGILDDATVAWGIKVERVEM